MNALVDYIKAHPAWRKELVEKPYCLTIKDKGQYTIFSYSQIDSDFYNKVVRVSRGIILKDVDTDPVVVCHAFDKFGNYGEGYADTIDWASARVQEKVDGCLDEGTLIDTPEGKRTIKDLCDSHYRGLIKSKNLDTGEIVWDEVEANSIQENINNWYEITLENGKTLLLTGNHRIWLPELQCWRRVDELDGTEKVDVV